MTLKWRFLAAAMTVLVESIFGQKYLGLGYIPDALTPQGGPPGGIIPETAHPEEIRLGDLSTGIGGVYRGVQGLLGDSGSGLLGIQDTLRLFEKNRGGGAGAGTAGANAQCLPKPGIIVTQYRVPSSHGSSSKNPWTFNPWPSLPWPANPWYGRTIQEFPLASGCRNPCWC